MLLSELQELYAPELHGSTWMDDAAASAADAGVQVIDDVADDAPEALADHTAALTTDLVRQYLNDAGRHALLTKEDEADLAKRYQAGLAADELMASKEDPLTRARKARMRNISRDGARAKERMVQANLRLVVPQARKFSGRDLDFIELIQEGNLGLLRAVEKFDHTKGYKFSTYAVWWIRQALQRGVASKGRTIRVPAHVWELYGKLRSAELRLRQQKGGDPTEEEIAEEVGLTAVRVREVREAMQELVSLDRPIGEDGDATMGDLIADAGVRRPGRDRARGRRDVADQRRAGRPRRARADHPGAALRPRRRGAADARGDRRPLRADPRAHPPDAEPRAGQAASPLARAQPVRVCSTCSTAPPDPTHRTSARRAPPVRSRPGRRVRVGPSTTRTRPLAARRRRRSSSSCRPVASALVALWPRADALP